ncbi:Aminotransferase class I and II [Roseicitreum antarcticum]|uniref:Aminotransferase class I and II n=1 Tax=Roseicitreum antarcticum TaxID=564137 RepID=A0A1H2VL18_9RHOB|nr:Aminotransferase class I and II [Roseicitreum antarcticum]
MFEALPPAQPDAIIKLMQQFRDDPREGKVDLGVGVYRDARGQTPVMRAVKAAEGRLLAHQDTKAYVALAGDAGFHAAMAQLVLGQDVAMDSLACAATPGGTGALRQALELVRMARGDATIWVSDPTWPNHTGLIAAAGLRAARYRYHDTAGGGVDFDGMMADLAQVGAGDVVLLHGCCHNPTGADLSAAQWAAVADHLVARGALPLVDMAYQGFGTGLKADSAGLRHLVAHLPEVLVGPCPAPRPLASIANVWGWSWPMVRPPSVTGRPLRWPG